MVQHALLPAFVELLDKLHHAAQLEVRTDIFGEKSSEIDSYFAVDLVGRHANDALKVKLITLVVEANGDFVVVVVQLNAVLDFLEVVGLLFFTQAVSLQTVV